MTKKSKQKSYFVPRVFTNPTRLPSEPRFMHTAAAGEGGARAGPGPHVGYQSHPIWAISSQMQVRGSPPLASSAAWSSARDLAAA
jgi:hypothetical protein